MSRTKQELTTLALKLSTNMMKDAKDWMKEFSTVEEAHEQVWYGDDGRTKDCTIDQEIDNVFDKVPDMSEEEWDQIRKFLDTVYTATQAAMMKIFGVFE